MACFVDEDGQVARDEVEHCDVAVLVVGVAAVWVRQSDHVSDPLAHVHGHAAEEVDHVGEGGGGVFVAAEDPGGAAVGVGYVEGGYVRGGEVVVLRHLLAVLRDPAVPLGVGAGDGGHVCHEAWLEVVEAVFEGGFTEALGEGEGEGG